MPQDELKLGSPDSRSNVPFHFWRTLAISGKHTRWRSFSLQLNKHLLSLGLVHQRGSKFCPWGSPQLERQASRLLGQVTGATPEWGRRGPVWHEHMKRHDCGTGSLPGGQEGSGHRAQTAWGPGDLHVAFRGSEWRIWGVWGLEGWPGSIIQVLFSQANNRAQILSYRQKGAIKP